VILPALSVAAVAFWMGVMATQVGVIATWMGDTPVPARISGVSPICVAVLPVCAGM
jgi:hypothetical protein